jgi:two-component system vancomycin resistance associated response regulator VraR
MLTSFIEDKEVYRALDAGVDSYILKTTSAILLHSISHFY